MKMLVVSDTTPSVQIPLTDHQMKQIEVSLASGVVTQTVWFKSLSIVRPNLPPINLHGYLHIWPATTE